MPYGIFLFDAHAAQPRQPVQKPAQSRVPRRCPAVDENGRRQRDQLALAVLLAFHEFDAEQRTHAHAADVQRVVAADEIAIKRLHRLDPLLGIHVHQVFRRRAVTGQCQRVCGESGALQRLVHRAEVVLGATKPVDHEHGGVADRCRRSASHERDGPPPSANTGARSAKVTEYAVISSGIGVGMLAQRSAAATTRAMPAMR